MKTILLATAILMAVPALGQEIVHAPTMQQCRADRPVWLAELNDQSAMGQESFHTLDQRVVEMGQCELVDSSNKLDYYTTAGGTRAEEGNRLAHFINRHNLFDQFLAEDAEGKR